MKNYVNTDPQYVDYFARISNAVLVFTSKLLKAVRCLHSWPSGWQERACLDCITETMRCKMLILATDIGWVCMSETSWCGFDLTLL